MKNKFKKLYLVSIYLQCFFVIYGIFASLIDLNLFPKDSLQLNHKSLVLLDLGFLYFALSVSYFRSTIDISIGRLYCMILFSINVIQLGPFFFSIVRYFLPYRIVYMQLWSVLSSTWPENLFFGHSIQVRILLMLTPYLFLIFNSYIYLKMFRNASSIFNSPHPK